MIKTSHVRMWSAWVLAFLILLTLVDSTTALVSSEWSAPVNLSPGAIPASAAQVAYDSVTSEFYVAWENDDFGQEEILIRRQRAETRTWEPEENLSNSPWRDESPSLFFDQAGQGHILWTRRYASAMGADADGTDLVWRTWNGTEWLPESVLLHVDSFLPGTYGALLLETEGAVQLVVVWPGGYCLSKYRDGAWSEFTPWDYGLGVTLAQIVVDREDVWHAAAVGPNDNEFAPWFYDAYYLSYDGASWTEAINLSSTDGVAHEVGLAFDLNGDLHFLWSDPYSPYAESIKSAIWERIWDGTAWSANAEITIDNPNQAINGFALTSDPDQRMHLVWSEGTLVDSVQTDLNIYYRASQGQSWGPEERVYESPKDSRYPAVAVGAVGASAIWLEGPRTERDVLVSQQIGASIGTFFRAYLPVVGK